MTRRAALFGLVFALVAVGGCGKSAKPGTSTGSPTASSIAVTSTAFADGATIPVKYSCAGDNVSPPLAWSGVPQGTASIAIIVDDPDAPRGTFTHWIVTGLEPTRTSIGEDEHPAGATFGNAGNGSPEYIGMCPPSGPAHHYRFTVYAERTKPDATVSAIQAAAIAQGRLTGLFAKQ